MLTFIRELAHTLFRFVVVWMLDTIALLLTSALVPGISFDATRNTLVVATAAAFLLGIVNFLIRPLILLLALPFGLIAIFLVGLFLNALALFITSQLLVGFTINSWLDAFVGSFVLAVLNTLFGSIIAFDNDDSFYQSIAEQLAKREQVFTQDETQGLVMLEIDGLSYHHIQRAIAQGWMPTLKRLMEEEGYVLSRFDCGLPSQTSACQAGIMFGNNYDIPAFRWYDKTQQKLMVSSHDAPEINARYAQGSGLMRAGSSVNNMLNGDAHNSLFTLADFFGGTPEQQRHRAQDVYLVMLNPYFFLRELVLYFGDVIREVIEGLIQQIRRQEPRLNRLAHFYPWVRAATTVLMRDLAAALTILEIVRGTPALYMTWPGYDEVAHHSGPWTRDAFRTLHQFDKVIQRVHDTLQNKAPRPYELVILSDHGQSYGWTFKQRYGKTLRELIKELTPQETGVMQTIGGDTGIVSVNAMMMELENLQRQNMGGRVGRRVIRNAKRAAERGMSAATTRDQENSPENARDPRRLTDSPTNGPSDQATDIIVCGSGNLAQVYFTGYAEHVTAETLNQLFPRLLDALVQHQGIGIVMAYNHAGQAIVFGKEGARNVFTNQVTGTDPLLAYGDANLRAAQLKRLAEFPHNGDLTIISTFYPDRTVAAMEELVGNHGGLGGEQTDAFIFHPNTFTVTETSNSADVFHILNARRGVVPPAKIVQPMRQADAWSPRVLWQGLTHVSKWAPLAFRSLLLDRAAYRQASFNPYMTAPALLIAGTINFLVMGIVRGEIDLGDWAARMFVWFLSVLFVFGAARLLRGKADFTTTLRAGGFAHAAYAIEIFALLPPLTVLARIAAVILNFLAMWLAVSEAHKLRGWRTLALPFAAIGVAIASTVVVSILWRGIEFSLENLIRLLDFAPR